MNYSAANFLSKCNLAIGANESFSGARLFNWHGLISADARARARAATLRRNLQY